MKTPNRFISYRSKLNNKKYGEEILKWCQHMVPDTPQHEILEKFSVAAGYLKEDKYTHVLNPYDFKEKKNLPEKLRNWNFITPIMNRLTGEFIRRKIEPIVYNVNSDIDNIRNEKMFQLMFQSLQQTFINDLILQGEFIPGQTDENGQPIEEPQHPDLIKEEVSSIADQKAILGQNVINYVMQDQNVAKKLRESFYEYIATKFGATYKDVIDDEIVYKSIPILFLRFLDSENIDYIEDSEITCYKNYCTIDELYEKFQDFNEFKNIWEELKTEHNGWGNNSDFLTHFLKNQNKTGLIYDINPDSILCEHWQYTDFRKVYRIHTVDSFGRAIFYDVDEDYIKNEDEELETKWVKQTFEGYVIADKYYSYVQPIPHQRSTFSNPNNCKKSYNGVIYKKKHPEIKSIIDVLEEFQIMYNIVKLKLHSTINKYKGSAQIIPIGLLSFWNRPKKVYDGDTITEESENKPQSAIAEALYYMDATNMLFIDESNPNIAHAVQLLKSLDNNLGSYLSDLMNIAASIKEEAQDMVGFNRFRQANLNASDAVSNVNQGMDAASLVTEELFLDFNEFVEKEFQGIIDIAKYAYRNGKKAIYRRTDLEEEILKVDEGSLQESEFGVFVKNGGRTKELHEQLKQYALSLIQNGTKGSTVMKALKGDDNMEKIIERMELAEKEFEQRQMQIEQEKNAVQQDATKVQREIIQANLDMQKYKVDIDNQTKIDLKLLDLGQQAINLNDELAFNQITTLYQDDAAKRKDMIQEKMNQIKLSLEAKSLELKDKEIDSKERISQNQIKVARINPS